MSAPININPYKLLGLMPTSSLNEAKKAYYNLAIIVHPDKGGSANDMIIIKNSYNYVKNQLMFSHKNKDLTYEQLEEEFENFCKEQESKPPTFASVYEETNDWIKDFNKEFEIQKQATDFDPLKDGYGELMEKSNANLKYNDTEIEKVTNNFSDAIIEYKEPQYLPNHLDNYPLNTKKINDFSKYNSKMSCTDYKLAFSPQKKLNYENDDTQDLHKLYEKELEKRNYSNTPA